MSKKTSEKKYEAKEAIAFLKSDHAALRKLLSELDKTTARAPAKRMQLLGKIAEEVRTHARIEEEIFYPAYHRAAKSKEDEKLFFEAAEEHGLVDVVLPELEDSDPSGDVFGAKSKVLKDLIEHHAEEEETEMFPRAKKLLGPETLADLGEELASRKRELQSNGELQNGHPGPALPKDEPGRNDRKNQPRSDRTRTVRQLARRGKAGWLLLWLIGIPIPILLLLFLLRGCT